jgi:hypothetical protein
LGGEIVNTKLFKSNADVQRDHSPENDDKRRHDQELAPPPHEKRASNASLGIAAGAIGEAERALIEHSRS